MSHENTNADNRDSGSVTDGYMHARDVRHLRDGGGTGGEPMSKQTVVNLLTLTWTDEASKRKITVHVHPVNDMDVRYECRGTVDQLLEMDEHAWHGLYEMMGEVKP